MSAHEHYIHQALWDSMHSRFASALLHFQPLGFNHDIATAVKSELVGRSTDRALDLADQYQFLLRAVVGDARLRFNQLPPPSPFMRSIQRSAISITNDGWTALRDAAGLYVRARGADMPSDSTGLPRWWERYRGDAFLASSEHLGGPVNPWDLCKYILVYSGDELADLVRGGIPFRARDDALRPKQSPGEPEGNLGEYLATVHALNRRLHALQVEHMADVTAIDRLQAMLGVELMEDVRADARAYGQMQAARGAVL